MDKFLAHVRKAHLDATLRWCCEAGPTGFVLQRHIARKGMECLVAAPSLILGRSGDKIKTDKRDAVKGHQEDRPLPASPVARASCPQFHLHSRPYGWDFGLEGRATGLPIKAAGERDKGTGLFRIPVGTSTGRVSEPQETARQVVGAQCCYTCPTAGVESWVEVVVVMVA